MSHITRLHCDGVSAHTHLNACGQFFYRDVALFGDCVEAQRLARYNTPPLSIIASEAHTAIARRVAEVALVLLKTNAQLFPLQPTPVDRVVLVEFTTYMESDVIEQTGQSTLAARFREAFPASTRLKMHPDEIAPDEAAFALKTAADAHVLVIATRNAHLLPEQLALANALLELGKPTILLCLRNPYDAGLLPDAAAILCTCGDTAPSLAAAVNALAGRITPTATLPVQLKD